jgi:hypothetical protein
VGHIGQLGTEAAQSIGEFTERASMAQRRYGGVDRIDRSLLVDQRRQCSRCRLTMGLGAGEHVLEPVEVGLLIGIVQLGRIELVELETQ